MAADRNGLCVSLIGGGIAPEAVQVHPQKSPPDLPHIEIDLGDGEVLFGRVIERRNLHIGRQLLQAEAFAALRANQTPVLFAARPGEEPVAVMTVEGFAYLVKRASLP